MEVLTFQPQPVGGSSGEFDQAFLKKSNARGFAGGGGGGEYFLIFALGIILYLQFCLPTKLLGVSSNKLLECSTEEQGWRSGESTQIIFISVQMLNIKI